MTGRPATRAPRPAAAPSWERALAFLERLGRFGIRLGLERMEALLEALGRPERRIPHVVHVGGTNGKGSVSAMVEAALRRAGRRTGLYTSPHLERWTERVRIAGRPVSPARLAAAVEGVRPHAEARAAAGDPPTTFEVLTAAAYVLFAEGGVEWLVQEVGLGGRLDSTNVIDRPAVTVITNVGLDHTDRLGSTVEAIAAEKAGIAKPGCPLVTAAAGTALAVVAAAARARGCPLVHVAGEDGEPPPAGALRVRVRLRRTGLSGTRFDVEGDLGTWRDLRVRLPGPHQALNGGVAVAALALVARQAGLDEDALRAGLAAARWPGRLERLPGDPPVLLDGAHNVDGLAALLRALALVGRGRPVTLVFGILADKEPALAALASPPPGLQLRRVLVVTPPAPGRALPAEDAARRLRALGLPAEPRGDVLEAVREARQAAAADRPRGLVCVCGSLYLVGEVRARRRELGTAVHEAGRDAG